MTLVRRFSFRKYKINCNLLLSTISCVDMNELSRK